MILIKSLRCTESSCLQEFEGLTEDSKNIVIYYRSGLLKILLDGIEIVRENFFSPDDENDLYFADLDEVQERVAIYGICFPKNCTLLGLRCDIINIIG